MKKVLFALTFSMLIFCLCGCGKKKTVLHLYCWADYIGPEIIEQFEKENDCEIIYDTFDSNEAMYAKLKAGATGYDVIFPSDYRIELMKSSRMLMKLDHSKLPNLKHLDKDILTMMFDPKAEYSVPYMMSYTGIGYNKKKLPNFEPSWSILENAAHKGRMTLLDDYREVLGAALFCNHLDPNTLKDEDLEVARRHIMKWRKNIAKFENEQYKNGLANGEFTVVMGYSGDLMQIIEENKEELAFAIPKEGAMLCSDVMVIPVSAPNPDLAHKFINFMHQPEIAAKNILFTCYRTPNTEAYKLLPKEILRNESIFVNPDTLKKCRFIKEPSPEDDAKYLKVWSKIKTGVEE